LSIHGIEVRQLGVADAALYREIRLESLQRNAEAYTSSYEDESALPLASFEETVSSSVVFAACQGAAVLGIAALTPQRGRRKAHKGVVWAVYVREPARKMGIGRRLTESVIGYAQQHFDLILLNVNTDNHSARNLYESCGFSEYGVEKYAVKYEQRYIDTVLMVKVLKTELKMRT
jgi:ribosomal protein S18 acetylase RimI-like enzyme